MKTLPPIAALIVLSLTGCNADPSTNTHDHWNVRGITPSITRAALGYDAEKDGKYVAYQYENKRSIYMTLKRHLLNQNPENPFEAEDESFYEPRPVSSILPRPWEYINFEGLAWGGIIFASGGAFIPIPVDSVIGTFSDGGMDEFAQGLHQTFTLGGAKTTTSASYLHEAIGLQVAASPVH